MIKVNKMKIKNNVDWISINWEKSNLEFGKYKQIFTIVQNEMEKLKII